MATYLESGWYDPASGRALRTEVIDGAMDVAGVLLRAGIAPAQVQQIALKVRGHVTLADPHMTGATSFDDRAKSALLDRLTPYTTAAPELDSFVADCVEHVAGTRDLFALYLHLIHVTRMLQLLSMALHARPGGGPRPGKRTPKGRKAEPGARRRTAKATRSKTKK